jgi:predicted dehydrogenase
MSSVLKVAIVSVAHMHVHSYASSFKAHSRTEVVGVWDNEPGRGREFAKQYGLSWFENLSELLAMSDAAVICSENNLHAEHIEAVCRAGKDVLCEKPVSGLGEHLDRIKHAVEASGVKFMTAFPCRFSPAYAEMKRRVNGGEIGTLRAIMATNRGQCPFGWFVEKSLSGGGAMIDHVVHVADLLRDMLGAEPINAIAQVGNNMHGQDWEDTAMVSLEYPGGIFATLDSSWSRPKSYKTWGDVMIKCVGDKGTISFNIFGQVMDLYTEKGHSEAGYGADLDASMIEGFIEACLDNKPIPVSLSDGIAATRVSLAAYESLNTKAPQLV